MKLQTKAAELEMVDFRVPLQMVGAVGVAKLSPLL
jgi:hypothetical protein